MKPLAFDLRGAKKISGSKDSSTFSLKNGHKIEVAHSALPALQRKQLEKMPVHMYQAGPVGDDAPPEQSFQDKIDSIVNGSNAAANVAESASANTINASNANVNTAAANNFQDMAPQKGPEPASIVQDIPAPPEPAAKPASKASSDDYGVNFQSAFNQGQRGISEAEQVAKKNAEADIGLLQSDADARKQLNDNFGQNIAQIQDHQKKLMNDYANGHIDPKHYLSSMGTGQKIATAVGLLLGGFSGGFNHTGVNPAMQWLQSQQEKDIQAQQASMEQKKTLLGANQDLYKDAVLAQQATRLNMNDMLDHQIQLQAAKSGSAAARAAADQAHSQFTMQNAGILQTMAIRKTVMDASKGGGAGVTPLMLGNAGYMKPEEAQKEQAALDAYKANQQAGSQAFSTLAKLQTAGNRLANPVQSGQQIAVENAKLASIIQAANPSERLTPESAKLEIEPYMVELKDNAQTVQHKLDAFQQHLYLKYAGQVPVTSQYAPAAIPKYHSPAPAKPNMVIQNGVHYTLNPKTGSYE